jgi:3-methylfumaryl-CoA hydratase
MTAELTADDIGVAAVTTTEISAEHAGKVAAVLDAADELSAGAELPLLWHWAFFTPAAPTASLGHDGHPRLPAQGPTADLPRRMWAGGRVHLNFPLVIGTTATRRSRVAGAERKSGRSGDLLVVKATHEISQNGRVAIVEEQDLIYRTASGSPIEAPVGSQRPEAPDGGWNDEVTLGAVTLFRFSAITFNGHRIHYDLPYATGEEGYPGLVVHGPLTAILLAESARRRGLRGSSFSFRASSPLFADTPFTLLGQPDDDAGVALQAVRNDGAVAMTAQVR